MRPPQTAKVLPSRGSEGHERSETGKRSLKRDTATKRDISSFPCLLKYNTISIDSELQQENVVWSLRKFS